MQEILEIKDVPIGTIAVSVSDSNISEIIAFGQDSGNEPNWKWTHALSFVRDNDVFCVVESDGTDIWGRNGVFRIPFENYINKKSNSTIMLMLPLIPAKINDKDFVEAMFLQLGKGYDYRGLFSQAIRMIKRKLFGMDVYTGENHPSHAAKKWYCSELTGYGQNIRLGNCENWMSMSPQDIANLSNYAKYIYIRKDSNFKLIK